MLMRNFLALCSFLSLGLLCVASPQEAATASVTEKSYDLQIRPLLKQYCFACHNAQVKTAGLDLTQFLGKEDVFKNQRLWKFVAERVETGTMPPVDPKPSASERELLAGWIEKALTNVDSEKIKSPGVVALPRLTREEYTNTVR